MEEEFETIEVEYAPLCEGHEIDSDYEFDAPQFFVFTRQETAWDDSEAEQWFEFAPSYPPSRKPFIKIKGRCYFLSCLEKWVEFVFFFCLKMMNHWMSLVVILIIHIVVVVVTYYAWPRVIDRCIKIECFSK